MRGRPETLFWGLLVLLGAGWLLLVGCGSESPPGPSGRGEGKQQAASQEPGARPVRLIPLPPRPQDRARSGEALDPALHLGPPPVGPGEVGLTEAELRSGPPPLDPEACEVGPPLKDGERGITLGELLAAPQENIGPEVFEVAPPMRPGERGMTQAELERRLRNQGPPPLDPEACEIGPPLKDGERGITLGELLAAPQENIDPEVFEVAPPMRPGERGITQAELERRLRIQGPRRD